MVRFMVNYFIGRNIRSNDRFTRGILSHLRRQAARDTSRNYEVPSPSQALRACVSIRVNQLIVEPERGLLTARRTKRVHQSLYMAAFSAVILFGRQFIHIDSFVRRTTAMLTQ